MLPSVSRGTPRRRLPNEARAMALSKMETVVILTPIQEAFLIAVVDRPVLGKGVLTGQDAMAASHLRVMGLVRIDVAPKWSMPMAFPTKWGCAWVSEKYLGHPPVGEDERRRAGVPCTVPERRAEGEKEADEQQLVLAWRSCRDRSEPHLHRHPRRAPA